MSLLGEGYLFFKNGNHFIWFLMSVLFFSMASLIHVVRIVSFKGWPVVLIGVGIYALLAALHVTTRNDAIEYTRLGVRSDWYSTDCIWFNGIVAFAYVMQAALLMIRWIGAILRRDVARFNARGA
jgi:hypothetical protein